MKEKKDVEAAQGNHLGWNLPSCRQHTWPSKSLKCGKQMAGLFQELSKWTGSPISMELINLIRFWQLLDDDIYEEVSMFACRTI